MIDCVEIGVFGKCNKLKGNKMTVAHNRLPVACTSGFTPVKYFLV